MLVRGRGTEGKRHALGGAAEVVDDEAGSNRLDERRGAQAQAIADAGRGGASRRAPSPISAHRRRTVSAETVVGVRLHRNAFGGDQPSRAIGRVAFAFERGARQAKGY